jgi:hypothetical protein
VASNSVTIAILTRTTTAQLGNDIYSATGVAADAQVADGRPAWAASSGEATTGTSASAQRVLRESAANRVRASANDLDLAAVTADIDRRNSIDRITGDVYQGSYSVASQWTLNIDRRCREHIIVISSCYACTQRGVRGIERCTGEWDHQ